MRRAYAVSHGDVERAVVVCIGIVRSDINKSKATHVAFVLDSKGKNFRHKLYEDYKNRERDPVITKAMIVMTKKVVVKLEEMNIKTVVIKGYEADDIIGALTKTAELHMPVRIVSNDKDMTQLIRKNVEVQRNKEIITRKNCESIMGAKPKRVVCMLMVLGDAIDNVPGIAGIGPVAAAKLIATSKRIETADTSVLNKAQRQAFESHRPVFKLSRKLITLASDCMEVELPEYAYKRAKQTGFGKL